MNLLRRDRRGVYGKRKEEKGIRSHHENARGVALDLLRARCRSGQRYAQSQKIPKKNIKTRKPRRTQSSTLSIPNGGSIRNENRDDYIIPILFIGFRLGRIKMIPTNWDLTRI